MSKTEFVFNYLIIHPIWGAYNGNAYPMDSVEKNFTKNPLYAFSYTEKRANEVKDRFPAMFSKCEIKHISLFR